MALHKSPFKFLDSYTKEDKNIFFGRERETEELYQKVFESKILLVYGITGTGKTSLINCGLANKFNDSDWLPIYIRRNQNILESVTNELSKVSFDQKKVGTDKKSILKLLQSVYLDNFKPIYLLFDQFEELFIFGNQDERKEFVDLIDAVNQSDIQCKCLFVLREEYLANITEFERTIPEFFQNRIRIEKMSPAKALETITGPCKAVGIEIEEQVADDLLQKVSKDKSQVELTYLQVLLDKVYQLAEKESDDRISITKDIVQKIGDVEDILGGFLEQQIKTFENSDDVLNILKSFVSVHGTKKQVSPEDINDHLKTFGQEIDSEQLSYILQQLVSRRILKEKDEQGHYELIHDAIAAKIYEKITLLEKELIEIREFLKNAYFNFEKRKVLLSNYDLSYIAPYRDKLFLSKKELDLIEKSEKELNKQIIIRRVVFSGIAFVVIIILIGFSLWALNEKNKATNALNEREIAEKKLDEAAKDFVISPTQMNIFYIGVENPIKFAIPGEQKGSLSFVFSEPCRFEVYKEGGIIMPSRKGRLDISVYRIFDEDTLLLGVRTFRVTNVPDPIASVGNKRGGPITKSDLLAEDQVSAVMENFMFDIQFRVTEFTISTVDRAGYYITSKSKSNLFTQEQKKIFRLCRSGQTLFIHDIKAIGPDGSKRNINGIIFTIK
ncbi:MAG: GldM family protein [Bacteroidales bacterium]